MKQILILSAPPSSGKDLAADYISSAYEAEHLRFKDSLYEWSAKFAGISTKSMVNLSTDRNTKETPNSAFRIADCWASPRQWLIHCSENIIKPLRGKSFFGDDVAERIRNSPNVRFVISDGGFIEELQPLLDEFDVKVIHIHRNGCTFDRDSRNWLPSNHGVDNNGTVQELFAQLSDVCEGFYK